MFCGAIASVTARTRFSSCGAGQEVKKLERLLAEYKAQLELRDLGQSSSLSTGSSQLVLPLSQAALGAASQVSGLPGPSSGAWAATLHRVAAPPKLSAANRL